MERLQLQRNRSQLMTVRRTQDTLSHNTQVTPPDICHHHSNSSLVICLEFPTARAPSHTHAQTHTVMIQKGELFLWYREECEGKKGNERQTELWFPLRVVSHEHEGGKKRDYSGMAAIAT